MKGEISMRKSIFEETGGTYSRAGSCLLPNLVTGTHDHTTMRKHFFSHFICNFFLFAVYSKV